MIDATRTDRPAPDWNRRDFLRAGALGGVSTLAAAAARPGSAVGTPPPGFGRARSCLLVFLAGGLSHLDSLDPKPDAPAEVRGPFRSIATSVAGLRLCEHLPRLARTADRLTIVRSVAHDANDHAGATYRMLTGRPYPRAAGLAESLSREDYPHLGSALAAIAPPPDPDVPAFVVVPDRLEPAGPARAGQHAGLLGPRFDPLVPRGNPNRPGYRPAGLGPGLGAAFRRAFDLGAEPPRVRERYGLNRFGQSVLLGRRLVEAGVRFVQVNWVRDLDGAWDCHADLARSLGDVLLPPTDRALAALLDDLASSGLLGETLVVDLGEFSRRPTITPTAAGREHWASAFSILLAGAGLPGGRAYGATDRIGAYPRDCPITPGRLTATIAHALGVDPASGIPLPAGGVAAISDEAPIPDLWGSRP